MALGFVGTAGALTALCAFLIVPFEGESVLMVPSVAALLVAIAVERRVARRSR